MTTLKPLAFLPLPLGAVLPLGWLRDQLQVQADGLTGHLEEFWPDLGPDNMWRGGSGEGWERGPYYLDGLVPLAHLLGDARLLDMAQAWLESILSMQDETGWMGPVHAADNGAPVSYDAWPLMIVLKVLTQHEEATGDPRVVPVMRKFAGYLRDFLDTHPIVDWGIYRWADLALSLHWLYDKMDDKAGEAWLLDVAETVKAQGFDWRTHFEHFPYTQKTPPEVHLAYPQTREAHGVNNAMAIKTGAVWGRQSGDDADSQSSRTMMETLDRYHGLASGLFSCDEHLGGLSPVQGTELCSVVEYLFSLEVLLSILGDAPLGDKLERIAYNALPGTFTADMWAHQYDGQPNQALCTVAPRPWTSNGDDSNLYGLEPHFGCCTANMHQGWPKFVKSLWMATPDGGLAAMAYGPCEVRTTVLGGAAVTVTENTEYPFRDTVRLTIQVDMPVEFPLLLRVPAWAEGATVAVNAEEPSPAVPATFHTVRRRWQSGDTVTLHLPMAVRTERGYQNSVRLLRGPLVFALRIGERFTHLRGELPHADWEVSPTTPWNYGLVPDLSRIAVEEAPLGAVPFASESAPVRLTVPARRLPEWGLVDHCAAPPPPGPVSADTPLERVTLIPYGSGRLRITDFPEVLGEG